jgi:Co/Zn/Cd efflux system component
MLLLLSGTKFLIGWAKPVPVDFDNLRPHRLGFFVVAVAGIVVNFISCWNFTYIIKNNVSLHLTIYFMKIY